MKKEKSNAIGAEVMPDIDKAAQAVAKTAYLLLPQSARAGICALLDKGYSHLAIREGCLQKFREEHPEMSEQQREEEAERRYLAACYAAEILKIKT